MKAHSYLNLSNNPSSTHTVGGRNQWIKQSDRVRHQTHKQHARRGATRRHSARNCEVGRDLGLCLDLQVKTPKRIFLIDFLLSFLCIIVYSFPFFFLSIIIKNWFSFSLWIWSSDDSPKCCFFLQRGKVLWGVFLFIILFFVPKVNLKIILLHFSFFFSWKLVGERKKCLQCLVHIAKATSSSCRCPWRRNVLS